MAYRIAAFVSTVVAFVVVVAFARPGVVEAWRGEAASNRPSGDERAAARADEPNRRRRFCAGPYGPMVDAVADAAFTWEAGWPSRHRTQCAPSPRPRRR